MRSSVVLALISASLLGSSSVLSAQASSSQSSTSRGVGASITPFAGYLVAGNWYDGPLGTNLSSGNSPVLGAQAAIPLASRISLVGSVGYSSGDLRVGVPILGGLDVAKTQTFLYDAGVELGGLAGRTSGFAPFVQGGIGAMTTNIDRGVLNTRATNIAYSAGVGIDVGVSNNIALRVQAKDWISRFDSQEAIGFRTEGNLAHNWALTAGLKFAF